MFFFFSLDFIVYFGHFWVELIHADIFFLFLILWFRGILLNIFVEFFWLFGILYYLQYKARFSCCVWCEQKSQFNFCKFFLKKVKICVLTKHRKMFSRAFSEI